MDAKQLFEQGKVREAQQALAAWLREHPGDAAQRTFLFELLCFSGDWDRAERQLSILAANGGPGAVLYYSALHAERTRHNTFAAGARPQSPAVESLNGTANGRPFQAISDADPVIGARLEIFAAGSYLLLAFAHIQSIRMETPRKLRDTLWVPASVRTRPSFHDAELADVLIPAIYPFSWQTPWEAVWLGRETRWLDDGPDPRPVGQKLLLLDGEEIPLLELRELTFDQVGAAHHA